MGAEESHGYLVGCKVRDKDAVQACLLLSQCAAWCAKRGTTMSDELQRIYTKFGFWKHAQHSLVRKGEEGRREIRERMAQLRVHPPKEIAGEKIVRITDYLQERCYCPATLNEFEKPRLHADVIELETEKGSRIIVRPSGTEPKIKYYVGVYATSCTPELAEALDLRIAQIFKEIVNE